MLTFSYYDHFRSGQSDYINLITLDVFVTDYQTCRRQYVLIFYPPAGTRRPEIDWVETGNYHCSSKTFWWLEKISPLDWTLSLNRLLKIKIKKNWWKMILTNYDHFFISYLLSHVWIKYRFRNIQGLLHSGLANSKSNLYSRFQMCQKQKCDTTKRSVKKFVFS